VTDLLDASAAAAAWGALETPTPIPASRGRLVGERMFKHYHPLVDAADEFVWEAQQTKRVYTGIEALDAEMRGVGPGHLCVLVGYSHSGKTQLMLHFLMHNKEARVAWFTPDETRTLVLAKIASIASGVPARELERLVSLGDAASIQLLRDIALVEFPNLIVYDQPLYPQLMAEAYDEAVSVWGGPADFQVVDYLDLVQAGETPQGKFDFVKGFGKERQVPTFLIHQTSRSAGAEGRAMTISSGNYGGEQHATFMLGVRRKKSALMAELAEQRIKHLRTQSEQAAERISELEFDLEIHEYTLTANLVKNKRPGGGLVDEFDMELHGPTGRLTLLGDADLPDQFRNRHTRHTQQQQPSVAAPAATTPTYTDEELFS
jgi:hypothetical protein